MNTPMNTEGRPVDPTSSYVWYCAFGSNLWSHRFAAYLTGGPVPYAVAGRVQEGARNPALPPASATTALDHHELVFSGDAPSWGGGGVAYLAPDRSGATPTPYGRLWLITIEQFCDVFTQENRLAIGDADEVLFDAIAPLVSAGRSGAVDQTQTSEAPPSTLEPHNQPIIVERAYGRLVPLGFVSPAARADAPPLTQAKVPVLTFTRPDAATLTLNPAQHPYLVVMGLGLLEGWGLSPLQAAQYLTACAGNQDTVAPDALAAAIADAAQTQLPPSRS